MKIKNLIFSFLLSALLFQCTPSKKLTYNIPAKMHGENKVILLADMDKGSKLFKTNCGSCHGIFTKGKKNIPNFTDQQIESYKMLYKLRDPKNHAFAKKLIPEEMEQIAVFLKFIKTDSTSNH